VAIPARKTVQNVARPVLSYRRALKLPKQLDRHPDARPISNSNDGTGL
jgi:hypothetical protein